MLILIQRLKNWETRERKKGRDYEKERDKEDERKSDEVWNKISTLIQLNCASVIETFICHKLKYLSMEFALLQSREARRLKEFLEDYDDERDDPKFYKYVFL